MLPVIIGIIGHSNAGKTTLIEYLVKRFRRDGYKVGTIKHASHGFEVDKTGSDSYRHRKAGAQVVCLHSKFETVVFNKSNNSITPESLCNQFLKNMDIVFVEGFRRMKIPRIAIIKKDKASRIISRANDPYLFAIVSDEEFEEYDVPGYGRRDKKRIYLRIANLVKLHRSFSIAILAGGKGKRIGGEKNLVKICGVPMLKFVYDRLKNFSRDVFIVTRKDVRMPTFDCKVVYDIKSRTKRASILGLISALHYARYNNVLVVACDLPLINEDIIRLILMNKVMYENIRYNIVVPRRKNKFEPLCALYEKRCKDDFEEAMKKSSSIQEAYSDKMTLLGFDIPKNLEYSLINVNNIRDLKKVEEIITKKKIWHS